MLARSGPFEVGLLGTPAFELADDHRLPKTSPDPAEAFAVGLPSVAADVDDEYDVWLVEATEGRAEKADVADEPVFMAAGTEV